jgi:type II secretory pathway component PulK
MSRPRREGLVLLTVLFFVLLAVSGLAAFTRQQTVDGLSVRNRDLSVASEELARGGVSLAEALILQDRLDEAARGFRVEGYSDVWRQASPLVLDAPDGGQLTVQIQDAGARLNLNALFKDGTVRDPLTEPFLVALFTKVIDELPPHVDRHRYDPKVLAENLIDYVDADDVRLSGGSEDDAYQARTPPARPANRPLLSFEELREVEGFDPTLVEALRPYVDVYPIAGGDGVNPNTAPPWVLATIFHGTGADFSLADQDTVRQILDIRERGGILCADDADNPACTPIRDAVAGTIYPPPTFSTDVFRVTSEGRYRSVRRTVEAVIDRQKPDAPVITAWSVR